MYIYLITNLINVKKYVGQTIRDPQKRLNQHIVDSNNNSQSYIHRAIRKYGIDNFQFEVIDESSSDRDELNDLEEFYIGFYDTFKGVGYNCTSGGDNATHSEETKKKMSKTHKGKKFSEESKKKMSTVAKNRYFSKETRQKLSESSKRENLSPETLKKMSNSAKRENLSVETLKKMSLINKGKTGIQSKISKKVIQIDKKSGEEIACWFSMREIERELSIANSSIGRCCKGKSKTAGGYIWRYM